MWLYFSFKSIIEIPTSFSWWVFIRGYASILLLWSQTLPLLLPVNRLMGEAVLIEEVEDEDGLIWDWFRRVLTKLAFLCKRSDKDSSEESIELSNGGSARQDNSSKVLVNPAAATVQRRRRYQNFLFREATT